MSCKKKKEKEAHAYFDGCYDNLTDTDTQPRQ